MQGNNQKKCIGFFRKPYRIWIFAIITALGCSLLLPLLFQTSALSTTAAAQGGRTGSGISGLGPDAGTPGVVTDEPEPSTQTPLTGEVTGMVRDQDYNRKADVLVRFWRTGNEATPIQVKTNQNGIYQLELGNGSWTGCACESPDGYTPLFWQVSVMDGKVVHFSETNQLAPVIASISIETKSNNGLIQPGDLVILRGSGFGCSGKAIVELPGHLQVEVTDLRKHMDNEVAFFFPPIPKTSQPIILRHVDVLYAHGKMKSNPFSYGTAFQQVMTEEDLKPGAGQIFNVPATQPGSTQPGTTVKEPIRKKP